MINNDVLSQLQFLIKTSTPPLLEVSQQQLEMPELVPGQKLPAFVVANLPNGRFQVLIADKTLDMNLPKNTQPGDTIDLVFVTSQPRLTFVLSRDLGDVANTAKPQVSLSETARFLGGLLEKVAQSDARSGAANSIVRTTPLLSGAPANSLDFAQALRGALTQSGLFYESHQAQWVTGQRPLSDLLREPQGRLSSPAAFTQQADVRPTVNALSSGDIKAPLQGVLSGISSAPHEPGVMPNSLTPPSTEQPQQQSVANQPAGDTQNLAKPAIQEQPAHPETLPIVRQQLDALDSRQVMWQGQVWPGQSMEWQIEERAAREQGGEITQPEWQTSLHLILPQLGEIGAKLMLHPQGIRIQLDAANPASAKLMAEQRAALQQGMETSGLQLVEMKVRHDQAG